MDFIERIFSVSPDGGNGFLELLYLFILIAAAALITHTRLRRRAAKSRIEKH